MKKNYNMFCITAITTVCWLSWHWFMPLSLTVKSCETKQQS